MAKKAEPVRVPETVMYIGPTLARKNLSHAQVFRGGIPMHVKKIIEEIPEVNGLLVPIGEINAMRARVETPGSYEHKLFVEVSRKGRGE